MSAGRCVREDELLDALGARFVGAELEEHVASCPSCSELREVAGALLDDRAQAMMEAPVPSAGTMWWRMQMRYRQETQAIARRSLLVGQAVSIAVAFALVVTLLGATFTDEMREVREVFSSIRVSTPMLLAIATWVLIAPIFGYVAIKQK